MALAAAGQPAAAREAWGIAAGYPVAFYGQLGGLALGEGPERLAQRIRAINQPSATPAQNAAFMNREVARIIPLLAEMGEGRRARVFLLRIEDLSTQPWERTLLIQLANRSGRPENPVWVARRAGASGAMLVPDGWPSPYPSEGLAIEPALTKAITRQESNFETEAISSANARGLMQMLPATAQQLRHVGEQVLDIHGQHAWQSLTRPAAVREMLDAYAGVDTHVLGSSWGEWRSASDALERAQTQQADIDRERERLAWQIGGWGLTQGQALSVPMILVGLWFLRRARA
jgi:hypothetical protein